MKQTFKDKNFRQPALALIEQCNEIIDDYMAQGLNLTLRQLYYQLVTKNIIDNKEREYKNLSSLISNARLAGLVDWSAIEDRTRRAYKHPEFDGIPELIEAAARSYRLPRWQGQNTYVELWVEKDALAGVLQPIADKYHMTLMVNRGYSSQSAMYESAKRVQLCVENYGCQKAIVLYLGDMDPSGEDMVRDIQERFDMFGVRALVWKMALTMGQVAEYNPPPNPTKMKDSRASKYVRKHGTNSWEVDALPPEVLTRLISNEIVGLIDLGKLTKIINRETRDIAWLRKQVKTK